MKKHPILYLQVFKEQFDETFLFVQSINKNIKYGYFLWSVTLFLGSSLFLYLGFIDKSQSLQIFYFISGIFLFFFALIFIVVAYSEKFPQLNSGKVLKTANRNFESNEESNVFDTEFLEKLFIILEKHNVYEKEKESFGLSSFRFKSKTQLAVLLNLIKFDSHSKSLLNINQKVFLKCFKKQFKKYYCIDDQKFKNEFDFSDAFFSTNIKRDLFKFEKRDISKIVGLNEESEYFGLYNEFSKILKTEKL